MKRKELSKAAGRFTLSLFLAILVFEFADQALLSPLINPLLFDFFSDSSRILPLGWVSFTFTILSAVSMMAAGILADRTSRKRICLVGCLIYGTFSALTILTPQGEAGYVFFFITRALNGIGIGAVLPAIFSMVGDTVESKKRATAFGFVTLAILGGRMAGFLVAGSFAGEWRTAYFCLGVTNLILAFGLLVVREPRRGIQEVELQELILEGAEYRFRLTKKNFQAIWANKSNFWLIINFIDVFPSSILLFLIFKYMKDLHNMDAEAVNAVIFLSFLAGSLGALTFGRLGDRLFEKDRRAKAGLALFCNGFPIIFMWMFLSAKFWIPDGASLSEALTSPGVGLVVAAVAAAVFINQGVSPNWYSTLTDINLPEHRATIISLASLLDMIGNALGPLFASLIASTWGLKTAVRTILFFWGANIILWFPVLLFIRGDLDNIHRVLGERAAEMKRRLRG